MIVRATSKLKASSGSTWTDSSTEDIRHIRGYPLYSRISVYPGFSVISEDTNLYPRISVYPGLPVISEDIQPERNLALMSPLPFPSWGQEGGVGDEEMQVRPLLPGGSQVGL